MFRKYRSYFVATIVKTRDIFLASLIMPVVVSLKICVNWNLSICCQFFLRFLTAHLVCDWFLRRYTECLLKTILTKVAKKVLQKTTNQSTVVNVLPLFLKLAHMHKLENRWSSLSSSQWRLHFLKKNTPV